MSPIRNSNRLTPGFIEAEDIRMAMEAILDDPSQAEALTTEMIDQEAIREIVAEINTAVATVEREAHQRAIDKTTNAVEAFLRSRGLR
jgi:nitrogen regulatory protein PII-like uncharacterized protein